MSNERRVILHPDRDALAAAVAARFITKTMDLIDEFGEASDGADRRDRWESRCWRRSTPPRHGTAWTGRSSTCGGATSAGCPAGDPERNGPAGTRCAARSRGVVSPERVHPFAASDGDLDLDGGCRRVRGGARGSRDDGLGAPLVRHHVPGRRPRWARRVAVPRAAWRPGAGAHRHRGAELAEAAALSG